MSSLGLLTRNFLQNKFVDCLDWANYMHENVFQREGWVCVGRLLAGNLKRKSHEKLARTDVLLFRSSWLSVSCVLPAGFMALLMWDSSFLLSICTAGRRR